MITNEELALMSVGQVELVSEGFRMGQDAFVERYLKSVMLELDALEKMDLHVEYVKGFKHAIKLLQEVAK